MPIGTLMKKIQCQLISVRNPPRTTPTDPPPAATNPNTPIALARSVGSVNRLTISDSETADAIAPPTPWIARSDDQHALRDRHGAAQRRERERGDADHEQLAVAVQVAEAPAEQQEPAERQQVGVDDPRQRRLREAQVGLDRRQRDVHDRRVEDDHQRPEAQDGKGYPAIAGGHVEYDCWPRRISSVYVRR